LNLIRRDMSEACDYTNSDPNMKVSLNVLQMHV